jgi:hypothetical protein
MTSRESEILTTIYQLGGRCSIRTISKKTGLSPDYSYLISKGLLMRKLMKRIATNIFVLTPKGKMVLERSRNDAGEANVSTLAEIALGFNDRNKTSSSEIKFINKKLPSEQPCLIEHNLNRSQITERANARQIAINIKRLTFTNRKRSKNQNYSQL